MNAIATKVCTGCGKSKQHDEFQVRRASPDGRSPRCKECTRSYDKSRANLPHRVEARKAYQRTPRFRERADVANMTWRERNRMKVRAHSAVARALKRGDLIRPLECEGCGPDYRGKLEAHHDDYAKPLDIKWLCDKCHKARHVELRLEATPHQDKTWNINADMGYHATLPHESIPEEVASNDDIDIDTPTQAGGACPF